MESIPNPYCKCEGSESIDAEIIQSDLVIIGDVIGKNIISKFEKDDGGQNQNLLLIQYEIKIYKSYKGINKGKKIFLYSTKGGASCGLALKTDERYIVFANKGSYIPSNREKLLNNFERNSYWSSSCSRTAVWDNEIKYQIKKSIDR